MQCTRHVNVNFLLYSAYTRLTRYVVIVIVIVVSQCCRIADVNEPFYRAFDSLCSKYKTLAAVNDIFPSKSRTDSFSLISFFKAENQILQTVIRGHVPFVRRVLNYLIREILSKQRIKSNKISAARISETTWKITRCLRNGGAKLDFSRVFFIEVE